MVEYPAEKPCTALTSLSLPTPPQAYLSFLCCFRSLRFLSRSLLLLSLSSLLCCDSESGDLERCLSDNFRSLCWRKRGSAGPSWRFRSLSWRFCSLSCHFHGWRCCFHSKLALTMYIHTYTYVYMYKYV